MPRNSPVEAKGRDAPPTAPGNSSVLALQKDPAPRREEGPRFLPSKKLGRSGGGPLGLAPSCPELPEGLLWSAGNREEEEEERSRRLDPAAPASPGGRREDTATATPGRRAGAAGVCEGNRSESRQRARGSAGQEGLGRPDPSAPGVP